MPKRSFWNAVFTTVLPYTITAVLSAFVTKTTPMFWVLHATIIACFIGLFTYLWFFHVKERRNGNKAGD